MQGTTVSFHFLSIIHLGLAVNVGESLASQGITTISFVPDAVTLTTSHHQFSIIDDGLIKADLNQLHSVSVFALIFTLQ